MVKTPAPKPRTIQLSTAATDTAPREAMAGIASPPPSSLHTSTTTWPAATTIHRVHHCQYGGVQFNPGLQGNARFSPIRNSEGHPIPTLYGGSSFACAAMESVFHDVPFAAGYKTFDKNKLDGQVHSRFDAAAGLLLADLGSKALIDTEKDQYPVTRLWAEAIHAQCPEVQGLCWTSRQDDSARSVVLFGDRIGGDVLRQVSTSRSLAGDAGAYGELLALAELIGVDIVPGRS